MLSILVLIKQVKNEGPFIMLFIVFMNILHAWYNVILWPMIMNFYTYILLVLWIWLVAFTTYAFLYVKDQYRMQYIYKNIMVGVLKAAGYGLLFATLAIGLYDRVLLFAAYSKFFTPYQDKILDLTVYVSSRIPVNLILQQRVVTILFLLFSSALTLYFVGSCSCQLEDDKNYQWYAGLIWVSSIICYLICMLLGYV